MNDLDLNNPVQVSSFGFNVPCREFVIAAQITRDKRLPMVDEFVLKALSLCESISVVRLARFFGFSQTEMELVLTDLQARTLIELHENEVSLHATGRELFRTAHDGTPVITDVESFPARIWFDLISKNMIRSRGLHNVKNLIGLSPSSRVNLSEGFAREAFQDNFRDYLREIRRIKNPATWSLYAISDVAPGRFSYAQIYGKQSLVMTAQPILETILIETEADRPQKLRLLTDAMSRALGRLSDPDPTATARSEYARLTRSTNLEDSVGVDGFVDFPSWLKRESAQSDPDIAGFVGSISLERNRKSLMRMISRARDVAPVRHTFDLTWIRPGGTIWGMTEDLQATVNELRGMARQSLPGTGGLVATLIAPASVSSDSVKSFDRIFDRGFSARAGRSSPAIEVLLVRDLFAVVSVLVPLAKGVHVWVGRITTKPTDVARIVERSRPDASEPELNLLWAEFRSRPRQILEADKS